VTVKGLCRSAGEKQILRNVSLEVEDGEVMAIMGPSGAGKTTLLRIVNMLDRPDGGSVAIDGIDARNAPNEVRRSMTMVFQKPVVFSMSVYDNIAYGLRLRKKGKAEIDSAVKDVLGLLDMRGKERDYARNLSGGEAQRVAFARAYVLKPKLLLLDEPTANLDRANVSIIERAITDINERYGTTVIIVTHNLFQARRLADRGAFMIDGELAETGKIPEIFEHPVDPRTIAFVSGSMVF
jgi:tungstate transport system ATP-binding protein